MNLKNIDIFPIKYGIPAWYKFRESGIGASEIGILFPETCDTAYGNSTRMYYEKIGMLDPFKPSNEAMFRGHRDEDSIAQEWCFWDGITDEFGNPNYINNFLNDIVIRKCRKMTGYAVNKQFPWLFCSPDRIINKGSFKISDGTRLEKEGALEIKNLSGYVSQKYTAGIPNNFLYQVQDQLLVLELDYAEFAVRIDGRHMDVFPIEKSELIQEQILERSYSFWHQRVLPGKQLMVDYNTAKKFGKTDAMEKAEAAIMRLEPDPTAGESYKFFITERFKQERSEAKGNSYQLSLCKQYDTLSYISKYVDNQKSLIYNTILAELRKSGGNQLNFEGKDYVRFNKKLTNQVKNNFDKNALNEALEQLNTDWL